MSTYRQAIIYVDHETSHQVHAESIWSSYIRSGSNWTVKSGSIKSATRQSTLSGSFTLVGHDRPLSLILVGQNPGKYIKLITPTLDKSFLPFI